MDALCITTHVRVENASKCHSIHSSDEPCMRVVYISRYVLKPSGVYDAAAHLLRYTLTFWNISWKNPELTTQKIYSHRLYRDFKCAADLCDTHTARVIAVMHLPQVHNIQIIFAPPSPTDCVERANTIIYYIYIHKNHFWHAWNDVCVCVL